MEAGEGWIEKNEWMWEAAPSYTTFIQGCKHVGG